MSATWSARTTTTSSPRSSAACSRLSQPAPMADVTREGTAGQAISDVFRGGTATADAPKDKSTGKGIQSKSIPAFVAGEALADLADTDARIVVLTADLAHANRTVDFAARHPD